MATLRHHAILVSRSLLCLFFIWTYQAVLEQRSPENKPRCLAPRCSFFSSGHALRGERGERDSTKIMVSVFFVFHDSESALTSMNHYGRLLGRVNACAIMQFKSLYQKRKPSRSSYMPRARAAFAQYSFQSRARWFPLQSITSFAFVT